MKLKLKTFDLAEGRTALIVKCLKKNPDKNNEELSTLLGMSPRTFHRMLNGKSIKEWIKKNKIKN